MVLLLPTCQASRVATWEVLLGIFQFEEDVRLSDVGRDRFHRSRGHDVGAEDSLVATENTFVRWAFAATREPWRLTVIALDDPDDAHAAIISWADEATTKLGGSPAAARLYGPHEMHGDLGLRRMFEPGPVAEFYPEPWPPTFHVTGTLLDETPHVVPELTSLSPDHYVATFSADFGVLSSWTAYIEGRVAVRRRLALGDGLRWWSSDS